MFEQAEEDLVRLFFEGTGLNRSLVSISKGLTGVPDSITQAILICIKCPVQVGH